MQKKTKFVQEFRKNLRGHLQEFNKTLSTDSGDWTVKGFIDVYRNIYTISRDTKVISKIIELMLFPLVSQFASKHNYRMVLSEHQNHCSNITFITPNKIKIALDLKSTYRSSQDRVNGFTLGAFTGYFRQRSSTKKNVTFPYGDYAGHFVLGIIYSREEEDLQSGSEIEVHPIDKLLEILSVARDFYS